MSAKEWAALIVKNQDLAAKIHLSCSARNFSMPKTEPYQIYHDRPFHQIARNENVDKIDIQK